MKELRRRPDPGPGGGATPKPVGQGLGSHPAQQPEVAVQSRVSSAAVAVKGWIHTSLGPGALCGWSLSRGGASGRGLALAEWEEPGRGLWLRLAARCEKPTRQPRLLGARPSTCCPRPAPGGAAMRLALLWALGLLGAGSPLPSRPLPDIGECLARSGPGVALGGRAGKSGGPGVLGRSETPRDPIQSTACPRLMFWAEDPATGRWSGEGRWRDAGAPGPVILCRVPEDTFRLRDWAPRGLAQHPLRIAIVGLCSPGLTSSLLWGLADRSTRCQGAEKARLLGFGEEGNSWPLIPGPRRRHPSAWC